MHKTMEREIFNQMLHVQTQKSTLSLANQLRAVTGVFRPLKTSFFGCMGTRLPFLVVWAPRPAHRNILELGMLNRNVDCACPMNC